MSKKQLQWKDGTLNIGGASIDGFTEVQFDVEREIEELYGRGDEPFSFQDGNKKYSGTLGLWQQILEDLALISPNGDITLLEADMVWYLANPQTGKQSAYRFKNCRFPKLSIGMAQGDKKAEIKTPFMFLGIVKLSTP